MKSRLTFVAAGIGLCMVASVVCTVSLLNYAYPDKRVRTTKPSDQIAATDRAPPRAPARRSPQAAPTAAASPEASGGHGRDATNAPPGEEAEGYSAKRYHEFVDVAFESQSPDPSWSRDAALELTQALVPLVENGGSRATRVECRTDLCRFEVQTRDDAAYDAAFNAALGQRVWSGGVMAARSPTEPTTVVVYVAKKGMGIPVPQLEEGML